MFRRSTSTAPTIARTGGAAPEAALGTAVDERSGSRRRHARRAREQEVVDEAALRARLERVHRRLEEVGSVQLAGRTHAIDNDTARRDPLTRPFAAPVDGRIPRRRVDTAAMPRPA